VTRLVADRGTLHGDWSGHAVSGPGIADTHSVEKHRQTDTRSISVAPRWNSKGTDSTVAS
jgi:hypothetical protein